MRTVQVERRPSAGFSSLTIRKNQIKSNQIKCFIGQYHWEVFGPYFSYRFKMYGKPHILSQKVPLSP